jgi:poly(3-hydroxybutyrate) depolymerase
MRPEWRIGYVGLLAIVGGLGCGSPRPPLGTGGSGGGGSAGRGGTAGMGGSSAAPGCSGKRSARVGKTTQTLRAAGVQRRFLYYVPANLDPAKPAPLLFMVHGFGETPDQAYDSSQFAKIADREGFIAIFPEGEPGSFGPWNVGQGVCGVGALVNAAGNDQAFVDAMIQFANQDSCIDNDHVFMAGFSMGGYFSNETGCLNPKIRAIAPHSGGTHELSRCTTGHKPVMVLHFETDMLIEYACATKARDEWLRHNGCQPGGAPEVVPVKGGSCDAYKGCPSDGQVTLCHFREPPGYVHTEIVPGHGWSGGSTQGLGFLVSIAPTESASELIWAFFKKSAW